MSAFVLLLLYSLLKLLSLRKAFTGATQSCSEAPDQNTVNYQPTQIKKNVLLHRQTTNQSNAKPLNECQCCDCVPFLLVVFADLSVQDFAHEALLYLWHTLQSEQTNKSCEMRLHYTHDLFLFAHTIRNLRKGRHKVNFIELCV